MPNEIIRVRVLHGFVLGPGEVTAPGDVIDLDRSFAMQVLVSNKAERVPIDPPAPESVAETAADPDPPSDDGATAGDAVARPSRRSRS